MFVQCKLQTISYIMTMSDKKSLKKNIDCESWSVPQFARLCPSTVNLPTVPALWASKRLAMLTGHNKLFSSVSIMLGHHGGLMRWLSSMLTNALYFRSQAGKEKFVLSVCCCVRFLALLCNQEHSYSCGEVNCFNSFPYRCYTYV